MIVTPSAGEHQIGFVSYFHGARRKKSDVIVTARVQAGGDQRARGNRRAGFVSYFPGALRKKLDLIVTTPPGKDVSEGDRSADGLVR